MASVEERIGAGVATGVDRRAFSIAGSKSRLFFVDLLSAAAAALIVGRFAYPGGDQWTGMLILLLGWWFWLARARLYSSRFITRRSDEVRRILDASMATAATVAVAAYGFSLDLSRGGSPARPSLVA